MPSTLLNKKELRDRRHKRVRARISGTAERPRLAVYKSNKFISVQLIDDAAEKTLAASHGRAFPGSLSVQAAAVGKAIAESAKKAGISTVVFDRGGYMYAGQVKAVAEAAREAGLTF
ncbi:50S ribosomal protein L18 [Patescibacteria group bacterium]|nr:50S ribosomal protein L18 [Patescibacteria group bacterium]MBU1500553.1 50S ribosomal protein L18 [Patescibacteria group bacterium]MBU2080442.1 50S ribosomal protein L18 [Patescibacteria group bacterium]MBU2123753.1 50S ribosomal protein L18 [Patescibacteria group bacterium]MBU2194609.1 50S ribosomal protein L18 [Patescibacteria group bacterium]